MRVGKSPPSLTANRKRVILARVSGKIVALAQPSACLTLPVSSGIRMKTAGSQARISTRLLDDEIDGTLIVAGCDPAVALLIGWMARTGSRINAVALPCSSGRALAALADGSVHVAGVHLRDPKSGDYNLAPVRSAIGRGRICVVNFARWEVGLASPLKVIRAGFAIFAIWPATMFVSSTVKVVRERVRCWTRRFQRPV